MSIDCIAASLDIPSIDESLEPGQQLADVELDPQSCCAQVMAANAG